MVGPAALASAVNAHVVGRASDAVVAGRSVGGMGAAAGGDVAEIVGAEVCVIACGVIRSDIESSSR